MEETGTDLVEVEELPGESVEVEEERRSVSDLKSKELTERMVQVMQKISEYGYLTIREIELIYANQTYAYNVVGTLKEKGLVGEFATTLAPRKAYCLKPKGYRTLEKYGRLRLKRRFLPQHYKPFIFTHRMACAKVGLTLEAHKLVREFMPESLLWERQVSRRQKLCDGEFLYAVPGENPERVGLEVELTLKNRDKLDESFRQLKDRADLHQVWWICGDDVTLRAMKTAAARRPWLASQRHFFCRLEDFLDKRQPPQLADPAGTSFTIDPAAPTLRARELLPPPSPPPTIPTVVPAPAAPPAPPPKPAIKLAAPRLRPDWSRLSDSWNWSYFYAACAMAVAALLSLLGPPLIEASRAPASTPRPAWRKRQPRYYAGTDDRWAVYALALDSVAGRYRLKARVVNEDSWARELCGAAVYAVEGRRLSARTWKRLRVGRQEQVEPVLEFQTQRALDRFFVRLDDCSKAGPQPNFLVQFN